MCVQDEIVKVPVSSLGSNRTLLSFRVQIDLINAMYLGDENWMAAYECGSCGGVDGKDEGEVFLVLV